MTQREAAQQGIITKEMQRAAAKENRPVELIQRGLAEGTICLPANINHQSLDPVAIGKGLRTKVNANIGTSADFPSTDKELAKLEIASESGADAVMDLSTGSSTDIDTIRKKFVASSAMPLGTVPIYQAAVLAMEQHKAIVAMTTEDIFSVIEKQAQDGVDFITVHCGVTQRTIEVLRREGRVTDIVSRGGSFLTGWMLHHNKENPLYEQYDRLLDIARRYDVTLSLGDGLRPGCLADATDRAQIQELLILGELVQRAWEAGVQVMVEGPGHVPLQQIKTNIELQKRLCHNAPFYVLGPLVTDIAPGYDHITAAIGGAIAAASGADFLCYVTPAEHLGLPTAQDVQDGIIAARIAAHAADVAKGIPGAWEWDLKMAQARKALDWPQQIRLAIDPEKAASYRRHLNPEDKKECTMCGKYCAMRLVGEYLGTDAETC